MSGPRVLLVAKPWRGGLADYLFRALRAGAGDGAAWLPSYPHGAVERLRYRLSRGAWRAALIAAVNAAPRDAALFVNLPPGARAIAPHPGNVLWLTDAPRPAAEDLAPFARVFVSDPGHAATVLAAAGRERFAGVLPFACDPGVHAPATGAGGATRDVCFIGNRDAKRDAHVAALIASGARVTVVGNYFARHPLYWRHPASFRPRIAPAAMGRVYARHRLSLNVHAAVLREGTNMRTFECAAYGIAQLVEHRPGLDALFEPGSEIATYREPGEIAHRVAALLADPGRCRAMAQRARERALARHTYRHRVAAMLDGLPGIAAPPADGA